MVVGFFEVAGLVLAIVPIVMAAADDRSIALLKPPMRQKEKDSKMADIYQRLGSELALLNTCLRRLISELSTLSEDQRQQLLQLDSRLWKSQLVTDALQHRLGDCHQAFSSNLEQILRTLDEIISEKSLNLTSTDFLPRQSQPLYGRLWELHDHCGKKRESFKKRFSFTKKEPKLRRSLKSITQSNKVLERLLNGTPMPDLPDTLDDKSGRDAPTQKIGELARAVYHAFASLWSCNCAHEARLCINVPFDGDADRLPVRLDMFISTGETHKQDKWQESNVHVDTEQAVDSPRTDSVMQVKFEPPSTNSRPGRKRRRSSVTETLHPIHTFCGLVEAHYDSDTTLEMMFNKDRLWRIQSSRRREKVMEPLTLQDLLRRAKPATGKAYLSEKARRVLAVILANTLLHLKGTQWLEDTWTKQDICFMTTVDGKIDLSKPYLASNFQTRNARDTHTNPDSFQFHSSPPLLGLGIMLLELGISAPIETRRSQEDLVDGNVGVYTDLFTASRVLEDAADDLHYKYRAAVSACLDLQCFQATSFDFGDDDFRSLVYKHVVWPLEQELEDGWQIKAEDVWLRP